MLATEQLIKYATFNVWANQQFVNWLQNQPDALLNQHTPGSFPSLAETLNHIWSAEYIWLKRIRPESDADFPKHPFNGPAAEMTGKLLANSAEFLANLEGREEAWFHEKMPFKSFLFGEYEATRIEAVHHCLNHSTFHRGQLVTMGRALGLTNPPSTDYLAWIRQKNSQSSKSITA